MHFESRQKETLNPIGRKRLRKGARGVDAKSGTTRQADPMDHHFDQEKKSNFRFDSYRLWAQVSPSKPAGPLSQDMLSLGGSFFSRKEVSP